MRLSPNWSLLLGRGRSATRPPPIQSVAAESRSIRSANSPTIQVLIYVVIGLPSTISSQHISQMLLPQHGSVALPFVVILRRVFCVPRAAHSRTWGARSTGRDSLRLRDASKIRSCPEGPSPAAKITSLPPSLSPARSSRTSYRVSSS